MTTHVKLSKRQKQIFALLEKGASNKQMAEELGVSEHTVKVHLWRLFQRIEVKSRTQALKWYHDHQPQHMGHALRAAFDAACRMADQLKSQGQAANIEEFEFHRETVQRLEGAPA
jgi:DNA-binding CsgD family transcriptional regulator